MKSALIFGASRDGYGISQIENRAITVGQLMDILNGYDEDTLVVCSHDNGYTYGSLSKWQDYAEKNEDGEWEVL